MDHFKEWGASRKIVLVFLGVLIFAGLTFLFGFLVMLLWNWLMPDLFSLPVISYWQAWGLVVLAHILFKGGSVHRMPWRHHIHSKWRSKFRQHFDDHLACHGHEAGKNMNKDSEDYRDDSSGNESDPKS